ncbi:MAG: MBL fold metallo-hydrolase [Alphaproteobacteria bacterium]
MLFRQLFDNVSSTYTYIIASRQGGEALIIDPVIDRVDLYLRLLGELDLKLVRALDTHVHADHITGLGALRDATKCITVMGEQSSVDVVSVRVGDGDEIPIEGLSLRAIYTPGHTDDSYCFQMADRVFTGDTLLIRGTGRTDFQHGDAYAQYDSLFNKLLTLPDETLVYPGHDYKGETVSTIAEERAYNPRLQVDSPAAYAEIMANLNLANPKMMDVAVPANQAVGLHQEELEARGLSIECAEARGQLGNTDSVLIDLRDTGERTREGIIPGSVHAPYGALDDNVAAGGLLNILAQTTGKRLIFYCAFGERSAMAVETALAAGLANCCHIKGGIDAWKKTDGPLSH